MALELTDQNFKETVLDSDKVALVDFWAEWCGPCRMIGPMVEELADEYAGKAVIGKVNVDHNSQTATTYGIRSIPTILFFKGGEIVDKQIGAASKAALVEKLEAHI
mgnify:FL=1